MGGDCRWDSSASLSILMPDALSLCRAGACAAVSRTLLVALEQGPPVAAGDERRWERAAGPDLSPPALGEQPGRWRTHLVGTLGQAVAGGSAGLAAGPGRGLGIRAAWGPTAARPSVAAGGGTGKAWLARGPGRGPPRSWRPRSHTSPDGDSELLPCRFRRCQNRGVTTRSGPGPLLPSRASPSDPSGRSCRQALAGCLALRSRKDRSLRLEGKGGKFLSFSEPG